MYPKPLQNLIDAFTKFPGVGPRQAGRFAFFLLHENEGIKEMLSDTLKETREKIGFCDVCFRSVDKREGPLCGFCRDPKRNPRAIAVVEKESDMLNLEATRAFSGLYHVLGGTLSPFDNDSPKKLRLREIYSRVQNSLQTKKEPTEVILATSSTTEGDTTALYIERILDPLKKRFLHLAITRLGRGLSLGSELEYADEVTLKNALTNRK